MHKQSHSLKVPFTDKANPVDISQMSPKTRQVLIWKERNKSSQILNVMAEEEEMVMEVLDDQPELVYAKVLAAYHCYNLIPTSSKLVVFDTKISIKKAFLALMYTGVRAAPLWDAEKKSYVGMLTVTDFIKILVTYYKGPGNEIPELDNHQIHTWREVLEDYKRPLVQASPDMTLLDAINVLHHHQVHRLPIIDPITGDALFIVTHKRILRFFFIYIYEMPEPQFMKKTLEELNLGSYTDLAYATNDTSVINAIHLLLDRNISALPVVDGDMKVVDVFARFDVINVAPNKAYLDLSISISQSLANKKRTFSSVQTCLKTSTLRSVMEKIASAEVHRLIVVNEEQALVGIISLSDILRFLIFKHPQPMKPTFSW